jgi:response regulator RpfG family c-di-GMP phosphodiesterase
MLEERVNVLFVDDEELVLSALRRTLKTVPWSVQFCSDPEKALEIVQRERIDVVISDHAMPGLSGVDLLAMLRHSHEHVVRMMMTGHSDRELALRAINEGHVYRFIEKPWSDAALRMALHDAAHLALRRRREEQERRAALTGRGSVRLRPGLAEH